MNNRRILILGAGLFQIRGIKRAKQMGLEVLTADNNPSNLGHRFADRYFEISTLDREAIGQLAKREKVNGIATFASDIAMHSVAHVASSLDLPGPDVEAVNTFSSKSCFREMLSKAGLFYPSFVQIDNWTKLPDEALDMQAPLMIKPNRSSGSKGVALVESIDVPEINAVLDSARKFSADNCALIEEFVEGIEVGGDAHLIGGEVRDLFVTQKMRDGFKVIGHHFPHSATDDQIAKIRDCIGVICRATGYTDGVLNFDIILNENEIFVIEASPRTGGNGISMIIEKTYGVDLEKAVVLNSLGENYSMESRFSGTYFGSSVVTGTKSGVLSQISPSSDEDCEYIFSAEAGSHVVGWQDNGGPVGFFSFPMCNEKSWDQARAPHQPTLTFC